MNEKQIYKQLQIIDQQKPRPISTNYEHYLHDNLYINDVGYLQAKWKIFLENYDSSKSKQLDIYLWKYPNISKLMYFITWMITSAVIWILIRLLTN